MTKIGICVATSLDGFVAKEDESVDGFPENQESSHNAFYRSVNTVICLAPLLSGHKENAHLVGDSAHAMTFHAVQGASMALENTIILAKGICDIHDTQKAFVKFQESRKSRAEYTILQARKQVKSSTMTNPVMKCFRAKILPLMIKLDPSQTDETYSCKTDWDKKIK